jgi:hypothetical protein
MNLDPPSNSRRVQPGTACAGDSRIAPYTLGVSLSNLQFESVPLNDLSAGGFSYWTLSWPQYAEVAFPSADHGGTGMMLAHVRKVERIEGRCLVHCQFVQRLSDESN